MDERSAKLMVDRFLKGEVTTFRGGGATLCGRPRDYSWTPGDPYYPSGAELARHLAEECRYEGDNPGDLMAVATYAEVFCGEAWLYHELRQVFDNRTVSPTRLHEFLARLPGVI